MPITNPPPPLRSTADSALKRRFLARSRWLFQYNRSHSVHGSAWLMGASYINATKTLVSSPFYSLHEEQGAAVLLCCYVATCYANLRCRMMSRISWRLVIGDSRVSCIMYSCAVCSKVARDTCVNESWTMQFVNTDIIFLRTTNEFTWHNKRMKFKLSTRSNTCRG